MFPSVSVTDSFKRRYWVLRRLVRLLEQSIGNHDAPLSTFEAVQAITAYAEPLCRDLADAVDKLSSHPDAATDQIIRCRDRLEEIADEFRLLRIRSTFCDASTTWEREAVMLKHAADIFIEFGRLETTIEEFKVFECLEHASDLPTPASLLP